MHYFKGAREQRLPGVPDKCDFTHYLVSDELSLIAWPLGLHYNHYVSVRPKPVSENAHHRWTTLYILIKFCKQMHSNMI